MKIGYIYREFASTEKKDKGFVTSSGDKYRFEYVREDDEYGVPHLVISNKIDIQEEINSSEPPNVADLFNRYLRGDVSALGSSASALYGDFSNIGDLETLHDNHVASVAAAAAAESVISEPTPVSEVKIDD